MMASHNFKLVKSLLILFIITSVLSGPVLSSGVVGMPSEPVINTLVKDENNSDLRVLSEHMFFELGLEKTVFREVIVIGNQGTSNVTTFKLVYSFQMESVSASTLNYSSLPLKLINYEETSELEIRLIEPLLPNLNVSLLITATVLNLVEPLENNEYIFLFQYSASNSLFISLTVSLPLGCVLTNQTTQSEPVVFPAKYQNYTDGKHLVFKWENVFVDKNQLFLIRFYNVPGINVSSLNKESSFWSFIMGFFTGVIVLAILFTGLLFYLVKIGRARFWFLEAEKEEESIRPVHLTIPEHKIINKLQQNGGSMLQSDLVDSLQFSKAAISIYLKKLEQKGVVKKESVGRTNKVVLLVNPTQLKVVDNVEENNENNEK